MNLQNGLNFKMNIKQYTDSIDIENLIGRLVRITSGYCFEVYGYCIVESYNYDVSNRLNSHVLNLYSQKSNSIIHEYMNSISFFPEIK